MNVATETVTETVVERAMGQRPSRARSLLTAAIVGGAAAVMTYRLLRREPEEVNNG
jgi:hypothetical protein